MTTVALPPPDAPRLVWALWYARRGWPVLPLCWPTEDGRCGCGRNHRDRDIGKAPLTEHGVHDATTDEVIVRTWWGRWPAANIGIHIEPARLLIIGPDCSEAEREYWRLGLPLGCAIVQTGQGRHYYYARPPDCPTYRLCRSGYGDILTTGYVVAPPSRHRSGATYRWLAAPPETLAEAPAWAVQRLTEAARRPTPAPPPAPATGEPPVRLSPQDLAWWTGERTARKPDGEVDRSATLYAIGVVLAREYVGSPFSWHALELLLRAPDDRWWDDRTTPAAERAG